MKDTKSDNYLGEKIPDTDYLLNKCISLQEIISNNQKFSFGQLFNRKQVKDRLEYHRNDATWRHDIGFNNWNVAGYKLDSIPKLEEKPKNEVKGLYIFYDKDNPIYVGISRKIINRLRNHFLGKTHNQCTLVFTMLRNEYEIENDTIFSDKREDLENFTEKNIKALQSQMMQSWKICIIPMEDNYEMYFAEIFLACHLKTYWNTFETH